LLLASAVIMTTVVCPATEKHVKKYRAQESFLVEETAEDYLSITLPHIQEQSFSLQVSWLALSAAIALIAFIGRVVLWLTQYWTNFFNGCPC